MIGRLALVALVLCATLARSEPRPAPLPLEAYGKLPRIDSVAISPDGKRLAYILTDGDARTVAITEIDGGKVDLRIPAGSKKIMSAQWAGSDHLILTFEVDAQAPGLVDGMGAWTLGADLDIQKQRMHPLIGASAALRTSNGEILNVISGRPVVRSVKGRIFVFVQGVHFEDTYGLPTLFRYSPESAESTVVAQGNRNTQGWLVGDDGELLAEEIYNDADHTWTLRNKAGLFAIKRLSVAADIEHPVLAGLGRDAKSALIFAPNSGSKSGHDDLVELAPEQTAWGPPIVDESVDRLVFDPNTNALVGVGAQEGEQYRYTFFDTVDQKRWNGVAKGYADSLVKLESMSGDHKRWVVSVDSPSDGPAYAMVDFTTNNAQWLGYNYEEASKVIAEKRPITFKAADGLELTGYLTLPRGREPKGLPLVVLPHGGPATFDEPGFDWWAQAVASRGYAVLQVEYRGSDGGGWRLMSAGFGQWGRKMQTDLSDGVRYLAGKGIIDPKRVCIHGGSYGGYAALAGATLQPGVYRCAISLAGPSDLRRMVRWSGRGGDTLSTRYWLRYMGVASVGDPKLDEISPLQHVDKVSVPILLIHGKDDTVVDFSQSQLMYDALKKAGKDAQLVVLNHEDHWLLTGATRLQMLQATMDFLLKNNPPG